MFSPLEINLCFKTVGSSQLQAASSGAVRQGRVSSACEFNTTGLCWKTIDCSLLVRGEFLLEGKGFSYLGVFVLVEDQLKCEVDMWIDAPSAVMWELFWPLL